jgi:hypothetical protein
MIETVQVIEWVFWFRVGLTAVGVVCLVGWFAWVWWRRRRQ